MNLLVLLLVAATAAAVVAGTSRTRRHGGTQGAVYRARLIGTGRPRRGRLDVAVGGASWRSRSGPPLLLRGPGTGDPHAGASRRSATRLRLQLADGTPVELELGRREAAATARLLSGPAPADAPSWRQPIRARTWSAATCLVLAVGWAALMLLTAGDGYTAEATVVGSDGGWSCAVTWQDPRGHQQHEVSDCFGEPTGSTIEIAVPWGDFRGSVTTRPTLALVATVGATPLLLVGGLLLGSVARRRRNTAAVLRLTGGSTARSPDGRDAALAETGTRTALDRSRRRAWAVVGASAVLLLLGLGLSQVQDAADRDLRSRGVTTTGEVVGVHADSRFSVGRADVRYDVPGRPLTSSVTLGGSADDYDVGDVVQVVYDRSDPQRFTVDGLPYEPTWTVWLQRVAFGVVLAGFPLGLWMLWISRTTARLLSEHVWTPVRVRAWRSDKRCWFATPDGSVWRSSLDGDWPDVGPAPDEDEEPLGQPGHDAWWVRDGEVAVFSPDRSGPLVMARLR